MTRKAASSVRQINSLINSLMITTKMLLTFKNVPKSSFFGIVIRMSKVGHVLSKLSTTP
jgi:hypothetical protein